MQPVILKTSQKGKMKEYFAMPEGELHTDLGVIKLDELGTKNFGDTISSHLGVEFIIQKPRAPDFFAHAKRSGAPMMPKDIGVIISNTGLCSSDCVLDAGTGSGILAIYLGMIAKSSEEMNFTELWDYVKRLKMSGYQAARYEVDLYSKLSFPLSSLLMVLIATPLSLQKVRSGGLGKGIALSVLIAFIYWGLVSVGTALGRSGALPPLEAAWIANVLFASASLFILFRMQKTN